MSARNLAALALAATLAVPAGAGAQQHGPWELGVGARLDTYTFEEGGGSGIDQVSVVALPFGGRARLGAGFDLLARGAWAEGTLTRADGTEASVSGLTDTEVRLGWAPGAGGVRLEIVGYAPTGDPTYDLEEAAVAGVVAADLLPFGVSSWGTGGGVALGVSGARSFGDLGAGVSVAYRVSQEFDPVAGEEFAYQPGDELNLRLALDYTVARSQKLSLSVGYRSYGDDAANGESFLESGDRIEAMATWGFPVSLRSAGALYGGVLHREHGAFLDVPVPDVPSQNLLLLGGLVRAPLGGGFVTPRVDGRLLRRDGDTGDGWLVGVGASWEVPVGSALTLVPSVTGRIGNVDVAPDQASGFQGFQAGLMVRFGPSALARGM